MPLKDFNAKLKPEQFDLLLAYCEEHGINRQVAGRIAIARLLVKKPSNKEIEEATVPRGSPQNILKYNEQREEES